jgi:hypothetical protein
MLRLVDNAGTSWTWASIQLSAIFATISAAWAMLDAAMQAKILEVLHISPSVATVLGFVAVIVGRLLTTDPKPAPAE